MTAPIATAGRDVNAAIAELATHPRWVCWKTERRRSKSGEVKKTRVPYRAGGQYKARSTDPKTWTTFDRCWASAFGDGAAHGVGFVLGDGYVGVDLDGCVAQGVVEPWARAVVRQLDSYTELSPSGRGLHVICRGEMAGPGRKVGGIEIYPNDRYFTVTGRHIAGTPTTINHVHPEVLEQVLNGSARPPDGDGFEDLPQDLRDRLAEACAWDETLYARWHGEEPPQGKEDPPSRSAWDQSLATLLRRAGGFTFEDYDRLIDVWPFGTQDDSDRRQRRRCWDRAGESNEPDPEPGVPDPDLSVLASHRLPAPLLPLEVFGPWWSTWLENQAKAKNCPPDYVALGLLSSAGALIGNARWGSPWKGWAEPPLLWTAAIGTPSSGKSPGLEVFTDRNGILPAIECDAGADYPERVDDWKTAVTVAKLKRDIWEAECKAALKDGEGPPEKPAGAEEPERPTLPRILTHDVTIEKVARLVLANPRGMFLFRDELAGWIGALDKYGGSGSDRAFYIEAYGARRYVVDRVKDSEPIIVPALPVTLAGGINPDKLSTTILCGDDDGLAARFLYAWPEPMPPERPEHEPLEGAKLKLERLYLLEHRDEPVPFTERAAAALQAYRVQVAEFESASSGLFLSWLGKLPGRAVRIATVLQHLYWCGDRERDSAPSRISERAVKAAITFLDGYAMPMARRCFGEASLPQVDRNAPALARWIAAQIPIPRTVNARDLRRAGVLSTREAERYDAALVELAEAGWVRPAPKRAGCSTGRKRKDWTVNPKLKGLFP